MALRGKIKKGDWISAHTDFGSRVVGQATHDMSTIGPSTLTLRLDNFSEVAINVNFWDVEIVKKNLISHDS